MNSEQYLRMLSDPNEKPLDNIVSDGGYAAIFRTLGCVGDSLSSGEFETLDDQGNKLYLDVYEHSWGQYLARMTGAKVYNFSKGGMTAQEYMESFAIKNNLWDQAKACQGYIVALGVNDLLNKGQNLGTIDDICLSDWRKNAHTFCGYYAMILQRLKEIQPDAKFFLMTIPPRVVSADTKPALRQAHSKLLYQLAALFSNTYVMDMERYATAFSMEESRVLYMGGHMTPGGYYFSAKLIASYLDYIVRHHLRDFDELGLIGTPCHSAQRARDAQK